MMAKERRYMDLPQFPVLWLANGTSARVIDVIPIKNNKYVFELIPLGSFIAINKVNKDDILPGEKIRWEVSRDWIEIINMDPSNTRYWSWVDYKGNFPPFTKTLRCLTCGREHMHKTIFNKIKELRKNIEALELQNVTQQEEMEELIGKGVVKEILNELKTMRRTLEALMIPLQKPEIR